MTADSTTSAQVMLSPRMQRWGIVLAIVLLAALVRFPNVVTGWPHPAAFYPDEVDTISRGAQFLRGDLIPIHASKPTHYVEAVAVGFAGLFATKWAMTGLTVADFQQQFFTHPAAFTVSARIVAALASCALVVLLLSVPFARFRGRALAALCLSLAPVSVHYGYVAKEDSLVAMWVGASAIFAFWAAEKSNGWRFALTVSALSAGLAISTKYNALPVVACPLGAVFAIGARMQQSRLWRGRVIATVGAHIVLGFIIGTPAVIADPARFLSASLSSNVAQQVTGGFQFLHNADKAGPLFVALLVLQDTGPLLLLTLITAGFKPPTRWTLSIVWLPLLLSLLLLLLSRQMDSQYILPVTALAAVACAAAWSRAEIELRRFHGTAALALLLAYPAWSVGNQLWMNSQPDSRLVAAAELEALTEKFPRTQPVRLLILGGYYFQYHPMLPFDAATFENLRSQALAAKGSGVTYAALAEAAKGENRPFTATFLDLNLAYQTGKSGFKIFRPQSFDLRPERYADKFDYVILTQPARTALQQSGTDFHLRELQQFLRAMTNGKVVGKFPRPGERGPNIEIYVAP